MIRYSTNTLIYKGSNIRDEHSPIADGDDDEESENTGGYTTADEVFYLQVALASLGVFHHDSSYAVLVSSQIGRAHV